MSVKADIPVVPEATPVVDITVTLTVSIMAILLEALVVLVALMISVVPMEEIPDTVRMIHIILPLLII